MAQRIFPSENDVHDTVGGGRKPTEANLTLLRNTAAAQISAFRDSAGAESVSPGGILTGFDFSRLDGRITIAVNLVFRDLPGAEFLYWSDARFWRWHHREIALHPGRKFTVMPTNSYPTPPGVVHLKRVFARLCLDIPLLRWIGHESPIP